MSRSTCASRMEPSGARSIEMPGRQRKASPVFSTTSAGKTRRSGGQSTTPACAQASSSAPSVAPTRPQGGVPSDARQMSFCLSPPRFCFSLGAAVPVQPASVYSLAPSVGFVPALSALLSPPDTPQDSTIKKRTYHRVLLPRRKVVAWAL